MEHKKSLALAYSLLCKKDRAGIIDHNSNNNDQIDRQKNNKSKKRNNNVYGSSFLYFTFVYER